MTESEQPKTPPNGENEADERAAQAEDPTSPTRGFEDLEDAEAQADEAGD